MGVRLRLGKVVKRALLVVLALLVVGLIVGFSLESTRWRLSLVGRKLVGNLPELSWGELLHMTAPGSGYSLKTVVTEGRSVDAAIENPFNAPPDVEQGEKTFRSRCALCHGNEGVGDKGPPLNHPHYARGDSDWVVYKVIQVGVPGTAMPASGLGEREIGQVVAFLRSRQGEAAASARAEKRAAVDVHVTHDDIVGAAARTDAWLTHSRTFDGRRFSPLKQISSANVDKLRLLWVRQLATNDNMVEATPLVTAGAMFLSEPPAGAIALDARTGNLLWRYARDLPSKLSLCCGRVNRGLAMLGDKVFLGTVDAHLIGLNAADGTVGWDVKVANVAEGYSITVAPLAVGDLVLTGVAGGEFGIRGFLVAYDAATGKEVWRFHTVPGPGEPGHDTWQGDSWKTGGGPTWVTGSYDPELDLVYWGVGNPSPVYAGDGR